MPSFSTRSSVGVVADEVVSRKRLVLISTDGSWNGTVQIETFFPQAGIWAADAANVFTAANTVIVRTLECGETVGVRFRVNCTARSAGSVTAEII